MARIDVICGPGAAAGAPSQNYFVTFRKQVINVRPEVRPDLCRIVMIDYHKAAAFYGAITMRGSRLRA